MSDTKTLNGFAKWYSENGFYHDTVSPRRELMEQAWNASLTEDAPKKAYVCFTTDLDGEVEIVDFFFTRKEADKWLAGQSTEFGRTNAVQILRKSKT